MISKSIRMQIGQILARYSGAASTATIKHAVLRSLSPALAEQSEAIVRYAVRRHRRAT